jgi:hypothetical protein
MDSVDGVMECVVDTVTDDAMNELILKMRWLPSLLHILPKDAVNELAFKCSELSAYFSADDGVSTLKSSELRIEPVVNHVSTPLAEGAADFSADDGVSTLKSLELCISLPVENQVYTMVARGACDFSADGGMSTPVVVEYKKTVAQNNCDKRKRERNIDNKKKKRREAASEITPTDSLCEIAYDSGSSDAAEIAQIDSSVEFALDSCHKDQDADDEELYFPGGRVSGDNRGENPCKGMSLCVFHQREFNGWCARGYYDCACCEGATLYFRMFIVKLRLV